MATCMLRCLSPISFVVLALWGSIPKACFAVKLAIWQPLCLDDPDCAWSGGNGMQIGVDLMVEHINREGYVFGGENVTFVVRDTACSATLGLQAAVKVVMSSERPFSVIGCGCSLCTTQAAKILSVAQVPIISQGATAATLSSRADFPHFFRTIMSDQGCLQVVCQIYFSFGWKAFTALFDSFGEQHSDYWDSMLAEKGVEDPLAGLSSRVVEVTTTSALEAIVEILIATNLRGVGIFSYADLPRMVLCSLHTAVSGGEGFIFGVFGWLRADWPILELDDHDCTAAQMSSAFNYGLRSGATTLNSLSTRLPCSTTGTATVGDFYTELLLRSEVAGFEYRQEAFPSADSVCMVVMAYNAMRELGYQPEDFDVFNTSTFTDLMAIFQNTSFAGVSGQIAYPKNGTAWGASDRIGTYDVRQYVNGAESVIGYFDQVTESLVIEDGASFSFPNGFTMENPPLATFPACASGLVYDYPSSSCVGCSDTMVYISSARACLCKAGYTNQGLSTAECEACEKGRYSATPGQSECLPCVAGQYQDALNASACVPCPRGTYSDSTGSSTCSLCPEGTDTEGKGFASEESCACPEDTFQPLDGSRCLPCGEGSRCAGFGAEPESSEGYLLWEADADGLSIFRCRHLESSCPGGPRRTCAAGRLGTSCSECLSGMTPASDGTCRNCDASDNLRMVLVASALTLALIFTYGGICWRNRPGTRVSEKSITIITILGQFLANGQALQTIANINLDWGEPLGFVLECTKLIGIDTDILRLNCMSKSSPLLEYVVALLVIVVALLISALIHIIHRLGSLFSGNEVNGMPLIILIGLLMQGFSVAILTAILAPFMCASHPNGLSTAVAYPGIICWTAEHTEMLMWSAGAVLFPFCYGTVLAVVTWKFKLAAAQGDIAFLRMWSFIFFRVKPHATWFPFIALMRSWLLVLSIVPTAAMVQCSCLTVLTTAWLSLVIWVFPYVSKLANFMEALQAAAVLQVLAVAPAFIEGVSQEVVASQVGLVFLALSVVSLPLATIVGVRQVWMNRTKPYTYFLSHHKDGAGTFARLLKLELLSRSKVAGDVFLDSDDLTDLDALLDVVAFQTETLVLLITDKIFLRPWCLAEIAIANIREVPMVCVYLADVARPGEDFIDTLARQSMDIVELSRFGLGWDQLKQGLRRVQSSKANIDFSEALTPNAIKGLSSKLISASFSDSSFQSSIEGTNSNGFMSAGMSAGATKSMAVSKQSTSAARFFMLADNNDMEAVASALVLARLLPVCSTFTTMPALLIGGENIPPIPGSRCVIFCSSRILEQCNVLESLWVAIQAGALCLPLFLEGDFKVPSNEAMKALAAQFEDHADAIIEGMKQFFRTIAVRFSPKETIAVVKTQAFNIGKRLQNLDLEARKGPGSASFEPSLNSKKLGLVIDSEELPVEMPLSGVDLDDNIESATTQGQVRVHLFDSVAEEEVVSFVHHL